MKALFTGLLGAGLVFATPTQAKFIGTMFYMPSVMLKCASLKLRVGRLAFAQGTLLPRGNSWREQVKVVCHLASNTRKCSAS